MDDKKRLDIAKWVELYTKDLLSWAVYRTSDKALSEDLVQDVFLVVSTKYSTFNNRSKPKTWLFAILNNKIADHYRKLSSRPQLRSTDDGFFNESGDWREDTKPGDWDVADEPDLLDNPKFIPVWQHCIQALPDLQHACIRLRFIQGLTSNTICQELGISASNYWQLIHRAKLQLRNCLEKSWFNN